MRSAYTVELALVDTPATLTERMNLLLFYGQMTPATRAKIEAAISAVPIPASNGANQAAIDTARLNRAKTAVFFSMISPDYLAQR